MQHPYQCLACIGDEFLLAACGSKIYTQPLSGAGRASMWAPVSYFSRRNNVLGHPIDFEQATTTPSEKEGEDDEERPAKKQKIAKSVPKAPNVIKLTVSPDQRHVVAVTDDKYVRVFEQRAGELTELSQRCMPKRPCAVQVLPDNATILIGDKFGDVYSLPLIQESHASEQGTDAPSEPTLSEKAFKPSATNLTVHSQRNLKALEAQKKQKDFTPRKEPLKFRHSLLLGHVSMLTDMRYLEREVDGRRRGYILTADRDEHIRISRGPPQSHVIEGFCLGHTQYISKMCQIGHSEYLLSGGGDDWLGLWHWPSGKLVRKLNLLPTVQAVSMKLSSDIAPPEHLAISGMCSLQVAGRQVVVIACEGSRFLIRVSVSLGDPEKAAVEVDGVILLKNNPLDIVTAGDRLIVSGDGRADGEDRLDVFDLRIDEEGELSSEHPHALPPREKPSWVTALNGQVATDREPTDKDLDDLLYGVGKLRKRGPLGDEDGVEGDDVVPDGE